MFIFKPVCLLGVFIFGISAAYAEVLEKISGKVLYSFSEPHSLVETDKYIYLLKSAELTETQRSSLGNVGSKITLWISPKVISFAWLSSISKKDQEQSAPWAKTRPDLAINKEGTVDLRGKTHSSINVSDSHCIVESGKFIYLVQNSGIVKGSCSTGPGSHSQFSAREHAIDFAWASSAETYRESNRSPASFANTEKDKIEYKKGKLTIRGKLLQSFTDPHFLIEAEDRIFLLRKEMLQSGQSSLQNHIGAQVTVQVPLEAIDYTWRVSPPISGLSVLPP